MKLGEKQNQDEMINNKNVFHNLKNFINLIPDGENVSRTELISIKSRYPKSSMNSIDQYRRRLTMCGYLSEPVSRGVYKKIKNIPETLTASKLEQNAYYNTRTYLKKDR